ncbi:hypothetical protein [Escherichia phage BI-EHEC]|nr:hypothetical protein [Escherichia phage BI-EHEC]
MNKHLSRYLLFTAILLLSSIPRHVVYACFCLCKCIQQMSQDSPCLHCVGY